jgi:hypothetical protein
MDCLVSQSVPSMVSDRIWIFWAKRSNFSKEILVWVAGQLAGQLCVFLSTSFHHRADERLLSRGRLMCNHSGP